MVAVDAEYRVCPEPKSAVVPDANSDDAGLISAARERALVLRQKTASFTSSEYQIVKRGEYALALLLKAHQGLIARLVRAYQSVNHIQNSDLEAEATLAFFEAVNSFDSEKGTLCTWAYIQIRGRLQKIALAKNREALASIRACQSDLVEYEPEPSVEPSLIAQIRTNIAYLTVKQQQVVSLALKHLGWKEIALLLQSKSDAVRMLWQRAVLKLRCLLLGEKQCEKSPIKLIEVQQHTNVSEELEQAQSLEEQPIRDTKPVEKLFSIPLVQRLTQGLVKGNLIARLLLKTKMKHSMISTTVFEAISQFSCKSPAYTSNWLNFFHSKGVRGSPHLSLPW